VQAVCNTEKFIYNIFLNDCVYGDKLYVMVLCIVSRCFKIVFQQFYFNSFQKWLHSFSKWPH